jgi:hypothetical protein
MEEEKRRYYARFAELADQRLPHAHRLAAGEADADVDRVARELHAMAGEAGLLGIFEVMAFARAAFRATVDFRAAPTPERRVELAQALGDLEVAVKNAVKPAL